MLRDVSNQTLPASVEEHAATQSAVSRRRPASPWKGLLWAEWFAHSQLLLVFLSVWLVGVWVLPLFAHPGWILLLGGAYALLAGPAYGGGDVLEGCEEFSFALPATRSERYRARLAVGLGTFLFLTGINVLALGLDLPHILARLYIDTGIIKARPVFKAGLLYGLVLALPFAIFTFAFALSAVSHSRMIVVTSWFWAGVAALTLLQFGFWYEEILWEAPTGFFSCPLLLATGLLGLWLGHRLYQRKDVGERSMPITLPGRWWLWIVLFILGLCLALALVSSLAKSYPKFLVSG